ncbi:MAG TPA: dihydrodipicolinate synthase family protein [Planctomycetaceae bacterium]|nr:dihydrodipicolinate synthase family protein [Planctomycetaceae bacterium]
MPKWRDHLNAGQVIPACPLALNEDGSWSEIHQRALIRYYVEAGAGGLAVGVHSTQFAIREPRHGLFRPLLKNVSQWLSDCLPADSPFVRIAGVCGDNAQAISEAEFAVEQGYHAGLLSLTALRDASEDQLIQHCHAVSGVIPIIGFYLQPAVGGRVLSYSFWRRLAEIDRVVAIKMAPFNRYQTWDVVRAVIDSNRDDLTLYTGNDDNIIVDLLTPFVWQGKTRFIVGGLLGQWGVWTQRAVHMLREIQAIRSATSIPIEWLSRAASLTDANAAIFDASNEFAGCIPGINEVLRRQGLLPGNRCLNVVEILSGGQAEELDRVIAAYPELTDDFFVKENLPRWLH